jgi:hypothetical protein
MKLPGIFGQVLRLVAAQQDVFPFLNLFFEIDLDYARFFHLAHGGT